MNRINWLKTIFNPNVRVPDADAIPTTKRVLNNKRNNVEAILNVKVMIVKLVCSLRLIKSLIGKQFATHNYPPIYPHLSIKLGPLSLPDLQVLSRNNDSFSICLQELEHLENF